MAGNTPAGDWWTRNGYAPETLDRILIGLCALIWLVWLGFTVAATVALIDLGQGFHEPSQNSHTGLLYIVIGISALVILAAVPVLLRARQAAGRPTSAGRPGPAGRPAGFPPQFGGTAPVRSGHPAPRPGQPAPRPGLGSAPVITNNDAVQRILLRGIVELVGAIGIALTVVAAATYLMAIGKDAGSWVCYGIASVVTIAMPVIPWLHLRQLRGRLEAHR